MSRVNSYSPDNYILSVRLPALVTEDECIMFKKNGFEMVYEDDFWFDHDADDLLLCFPNEVVGSTDVVAAIDVSRSNRILWSWSEEKGDIFLDGRFVMVNSIPAPQSIEADRCKCGAMGNVVRTACLCPKCGAVVWGC
jgi:hypothetical protein